MNRINFCAKIPVVSCQIQNKANKTFENATIYEYDCKDKRDIDELEQIAETKKWEYGWNIWGNAHNKRNGKNPKFQYNRIYAMESQDGKLIGLCDTEEKEEKITVRHLEASKNHEYKYIGQTILASLAKKTFNQNKNSLIIKNAQPNAWGFYTKACGFNFDFESKDQYSIDMIMRRNEIPHFVRQTEEKTNSPIKTYPSFTGNISKSQLNKYKLPIIRSYISEKEYVLNLCKKGYFDTGDWCQFSPQRADIKIPWKMHIFAENAKEYQDIANVILPYLRDMQIKHKCLGTNATIENQAKTMQAGKAITIYPSSNEEMEKIAKDIDYIIKLNKLTKQKTHIQGDRKMGDSGRIFYRYEFCSGKYSNITLNLDLYDIPQEIIEKLDNRIKWSANKGPDKLYRFGLYESNRGGNNYLASDMTEQDDIWLNFNPADPNSHRKTIIEPTKSKIYPNAIVMLQLDETHEYGLHIMDKNTREWFVYDKTLNRVVRDAGLELQLADIN